MDNRRAWLKLARAPGIGPRISAQLLERHGGDPQTAVTAATRHHGAPGVRQAARDWLKQPDNAQLDADETWLDQPDHHLITIDQPHYPAALRSLPDAPAWLFGLGDVDLLNIPAIAMVGSRNPSMAGAETARDFARSLAGAGLVIVSGLATGIDAAAHSGALDARGMTIAVTGTGLDRIYPARNRKLGHAIAERGLMISEFALGTPAARGHFPRRNRIIAGLATGTLVVEAALRSGSLITARQSLEAGREVFAIPGSIHNPLARGCHQLIRSGAKLVETADDVLEEIAPQLRTDTPPLQSPQGNSPGDGNALDAEHHRLLQCVDHGPTRVDDIIQRSGLGADAVSSMLLILELQGHIAPAPGGAFTRIDPRNA